MSIDFTFERWQRIKDDNRRWWAGDLGRPLLAFTVSGREPGRPEPKLPAVRPPYMYDLTIPAEDIVDCWDYRLSCQKFLGDAYPRIWPNLGPGVAAAMMGAEVEVHERTVWFGPAEPRGIADIHLAYDADNIWLRRIKDICRAAVHRWAGLVQVGMTDLGGNLDMLSSFRPGEGLLLDLYDHPEEVKRLLWEAHEAWHAYFADINEVLQPLNPGYSTWDGVFSERPYYILQCDFCYMISSEMFDRFVKPELAASCDRLGNTIYHLDGVGQLPHLDSLLEIKALGGVQWVPGTGKPTGEHWLDVYAKIGAAGKRIWLAAHIGEPSLIDTVAQRVGTPNGIVYQTGGAPDAEAGFRDVLARYGVQG